MKTFKRSQLLEFEVLAAIICVATLNIVIFASLSQNSGNGWQTFNQSLYESIIIYGVFTLLTLLALIMKRKKVIKYVFYGLLAIVTGRVFLSLYSLIFDKTINENGQAILTDALLIWIASILVFSMWYWIVDRDGPVARAAEDTETRYDLLFPQYQGKIQGWEHWHPRFMDYVFFSFFTSTGFSPADTLPLTKRVKLLMMLEASLSLVIIGMVASRAINLLQ